MIKNTTELSSKEKHYKMGKIVLELRKATLLMNSREEQELARITILEKEIEHRHQLIENSFSGKNYVLGRLLSDDEVKGRTYELKCRRYAIEPF